MNKTFSVYRKSDGLFTGGRLHVPEADLARNLRDGEAHVDGTVDHLSQRVDLATGAVVDYQPPQPSIDHEWNAEVKRWQLTATASVKQQARVAADAQIAALIASQHDAVRAAILGEPTALQCLKDIHYQIELLRGDS